MPQRRRDAPKTGVRSYFVTDYFGGKTYESNGIALVRENQARRGKPEVLVVASWCGGPEFIVEKWPAGAARQLTSAGLGLDARVWELAKEMERVSAKPAAVRRAARRTFERLLGRRLVERIHEDPLFN